MDDKQFSQLGGGDSIVSRNEACLVKRSTTTKIASGKASGVRKLLNKVHRD
jgi:hypothetical protein